MKKFTFMQTIAAAMLMAVVAGTSLMAQSLQSAHSLGMADSYMQLSENCEAASANPANLASPEQQKLSIKLISAAAHFANNSFTLADYNRYNGAYLTEADKQDILRKIPDGGLVFAYDASASAVSFSYGAFAFTAAGIGGGRGSVAKDPIELALMGNKIGEVHTASDSYADNWAALSFGGSFGARLFEMNGFTVDGGVTVKYLQGLAYYGVTELTAEAVTQATGISGEGGLTTLEAQGGSGYAADLGLSVTGNSTRYGLVLHNALASINWNRDVKKTIYSFYLENMNIENAGSDSVSVSDEVDVPTDNFSTRPPLELELGASRHFGKLLAAADLKQGFAETAFVSKTPRLAAGIEYPLVSSLVLRSGLAAGGVDKYSAAVGGGFNFGIVNLDLAYASTGTLLPFGGRGARLAFATILEF